MSTAMMAITTSSSIRVKPRRRVVLKNISMAAPLQGGVFSFHAKSREFIQRNHTHSLPIRAHHFAPGAGDQAGEDPDVDGSLEEVHRAVRHHGVGPARVEAIHFPVIGAIDGAGAVKSSAVLG